MGNLYYELAHGDKKGDLSVLKNNLGFLAKNMPFASRKAESHFVQTIEIAQQCGARGLRADVHLGLGRLYKARKMDAKAVDHASEAVRIFKKLHSEANTDRAMKILASCHQGVAG